jgi:CheY-like chemotaxis protein
MDTLLLVDDEPHVLILTRRLLRDHGYEILTATNGLEGQQLISRDHQKLSAIVLDWAMPMMTGIELLRWIKTQTNLDFIPVIMQTVMDRPENIREGIESGCFYYLTKPINKDIFQSVVKAAVNDFHYKKSLLTQLRESEHHFLTLVEGTFHIRTITEAEYLAVRIANLCPFPERAIQVAEILTNAVEHGNLGITYEEKTELIEQGTFEEEILRRQSLQTDAEKYVEVRVTKFPDKLTVYVEDQGRGFDFERYLTMDELRVFDNHGRGIAIANSYLKLDFFGVGNKVLATIPFE